MLIDRYLPKFDFNEVHQIEVPASAEAAYFAARHLDFNASWIARLLFRLRGLPARDLQMDALLTSMRFYLIDELHPVEFVIGGMAAGWSKPIQIKNGAHFVRHTSKNLIKIAWRFSFESLGAQQTKVTTETRVACIGAATRRIFSVYWLFVRPFSGLIRREMLRILKQTVQVGQSYPTSKMGR